MPRPGRLAEWLGVSAPTVTVSLQRLARDGLIRIAEDRSVELTDERRPRPRRPSSAGIASWSDG